MRCTPLCLSLYVMITDVVCSNPSGRQAMVLVVVYVTMMHALPRCSFHIACFALRRIEVSPITTVAWHSRPAVMSAVHGHAKENEQSMITVAGAIATAVAIFFLHLVLVGKARETQVLCTFVMHLTIVCGNGLGGHRIGLPCVWKWDWGEDNWA